MVDILLILAIALVIDFALREPPDPIHPVAWMGKVISLLERINLGRSPSAQFACGVIISLLTIALFAIPAYLILSYLESISSIGEKELKDIFRLVCSEEREELERLRRLLKESYDKESALNNAYEMEIASGQGRGIEYGLFISYGDAAESIAFEDPFWGKMNVAIAEKLNEAARGTGRNPDIKKKLDVLLRNTRRAKGIPTLAYPFYVFRDNP